jgi:uncharacterized protein YkwD
MGRGPHSDTGNVAILRLVPIAALSALSLCASAPVATALSTPARQVKVHRRHARPTARPHRPARCAKRSNLHSPAARAHHGARQAICSKRHSPIHHKARARRRPARHAKAHRRTRPRATHHTLFLYTAPPPAPLAHYGNCPDAALQPNRNNTARVRAAVLCLVNRERTGRGESPLAADARLQQAAQGHTESMAFGNYFEHDGPSGETPLSRMRATGYIYNSQMGYEVGENIGWGTLWEGSPRAVVAAWMASPLHRANILNAHFRNTGVGVSAHPPSSLSRNLAGGIYTEDFGVLIKA